MIDRIFVDTNIFVYSIDGRDPVKKKKARSALRNAARNSTIVISGQVVLEFAANLIKKLGQGPMATAEHVAILGALPCVAITSGIAVDAVRLMERFSLSVWDAAIIAAAVHAGCGTLYSEDLQHGLVIGDLVVDNPLLG